MIGEYFAIGAVASIVLLFTWLLAALPLAIAGVIPVEYRDRHVDMPRHDVAMSAVIWVMALLTMIILALGFIVTEILIPIVS